MFAIFVDPFLLTMPDPDASEGNKRRWLAAINQWASDAGKLNVIWCYCTNSITRLLNDDLYPSFHNIKNMVALDHDGHMDHVNTHTIVAATNMVRRDIDSSDIAQRVAVTCTVPSGGTEVSPPDLVKRQARTIRDSFSQTLACLACSRKIGDSFAQRVRFMTVETPCHDRELRVRLAVAMAEPDEHMAKLSGCVDERFPLHFSFDDVCQSLPPEELIEGGQEMFLRRVRIEAEKLSNGHILTPRLGRNFWKSVCQTGFAAQDGVFNSLLRVCSLVLGDRANELGNELRQIRKTEAGNSPQRRRIADGAGAWRATITKLGAGWRLTYWNIDGQGQHRGVVEFADVLKHNQSPGYITE